MSYIVTFSKFKDKYTGQNYFDVKEQLNEFALLRKMYICPITPNTVSSFDIDPQRINVYHDRHGIISRIEMDERDV